MTHSNSLSRRTLIRRATASAIGIAGSCATRSGAYAAPQQRDVRIFVHWDMEGASGIFTREQAWYWEQGVRENVAAEARQLFTADVNSLSAAALEAGASNLIV